MIHMSQVRVPVGKACKGATTEQLRHGIITEHEQHEILKSACHMLRIAPETVKEFHVRRKSLDARKKHQIQFIYMVELSCKAEEKVVRKYGKNDVKLVQNDSFGEPVAQNTSSVKEECLKKQPAPTVIGMGPAGLFAAYTLAKAGLCPLVIERGSDVEKRQEKVETFWKTGVLDSSSNVQFGEGGAGTFSDGKLNTMVKDKSGRNRKVLETFVSFGAPSEILYLHKPHIGTNRLRKVVKAMRGEIIRLGGTVLFDTQVTDFIIENKVLKGIVVQNSKEERTISCQQVILATGHSARDTFSVLRQRGLPMQQKPFAIGVRVEHPQEMIAVNQYGDLASKLPVADYKLTYTTKQGRGVYSFCMCPGGYVVNASSEQGHLAVNGMSNYERDGKNANSAIVVTVDPKDFGSDDVLAGVAFQRKWEQAAFQAAGGKIPVQLLGDFLEKRISTGFGEITPSMKGGYAFGDVRSVLPDYVGDSIAEGMTAFERYIKGYSRKDALLSGIESRTSSPVRMLRDDTLQSEIRGVYPCGEGAGYAGGITSAAMDGIRVAEQIIQNF